MVWECSVLRASIKGPYKLVRTGQFKTAKILNIGLLRLYHIEHMKVRFRLMAVGVVLRYPFSWRYNHCYWLFYSLVFKFYAVFSTCIAKNSNSWGFYDLASKNNRELSVENLTQNHRTERK